MNKPDSTPRPAPPADNSSGLGVISLICADAGLQCLGARMVKQWQEPYLIKALIKALDLPKESVFNIEKCRYIRFDKLLKQQKVTNVQPIRLLEVDIPARQDGSDQTKRIPLTVYPYVPAEEEEAN